MTRVILGVQGAQTPWNRGRGIARYITEQALALAAGGEPVAIHADPELAAPGLLERLPAGRLAAIPPAPEPGLVYHVMSPFEELPLDRVWPLWARRPEVALAVTLYDLIPLLDPGSYLVSAWLETYYRARLELLRTADAVLTISAATAREAARLLDLDPARVHDVSTGCSEHFRPPAAGERPLEAARDALPGLREGFLLYVGGLDPRKNVDRLVRAYAALPGGVRAGRQLIVACRPEPEQARALRALAARLGVAGDVLLTGYVDDGVLRALYQSCRAHVMPSLSEGFGLPVLEALNCGAACAVSDIPTLTDLVPDPEAAFDPGSEAAVRAMLERLAGDDGWVARRRARAAELAAPHTWPRVAAASRAAYASARARRSPITRSRKAS